MDKPIDTKVVLVLKGPLAGHTGKLRHWYFKDGKHTLTAPPSEQGKIIKYLNRCYQAVPEGQESYDGNSEPLLDVRLVLQGPLAGHTGKLRQWDFVDGVCTLHDLPENLEGIIKYLGLCYQAFPDGKRKKEITPEDRSALAAALRKEAKDGKRNVSEEALEDEDTEVRGNVQPDGEGGQSSSTGHISFGNEGEAGGAGIQAEGDSGSSRLLRVIEELDPANSKHWTKSGDPSVFAVRTLMGDESINKGHLSEVWDFENHKLLG